MDLVFRAINVSFATPDAVDISVCIGIGDKARPYQLVCGVMALVPLMR